MIFPRGTVVTEKTGSIVPFYLEIRAQWTIQSISKWLKIQADLEYNWKILNKIRKMRVRALFPLNPSLFRSY
jgi:hypothetical protein